MGSNHRYAGTPRSIPTWAASVGAMLASGTRVKAACECGFVEVDLADLDPAFSFWDREDVCGGCGQVVVWLIANGACFRPARTRRD